MHASVILSPRTRWVLAVIGGISLPVAGCVFGFPVSDIPVSDAAADGALADGALADGAGGDGAAGPACGNGVIDPGEECDDANLRSHDGCSSGCTLEQGEWVQVAPISAPAARQQHAAAYDSARQRVVLFGGTAGATELSDTWEFDGTEWWPQSPGTEPPGRDGSTMAFDSGRQVTVLFGGYGGAAELDDHWEWNGVDWVQRSPVARPSPRAGHFMVYDALRSRVVLFGGQTVTPGLVQLDDTWEYDGTDWLEIVPAASPPARAAHSMAFDSDRGVTVLFGGNANGFVADTWEYDGAWREVTVSAAPDPRAAMEIAYDSLRQRVVLFGGVEQTAFAPYGDTWAYDSVGWQYLSSGGPVARHSMVLVYDTARGRVVLFGGQDAAQGELGDTWEHYSTSSWPDEICDNGLDDDDDTAVDCDDPDCGPGFPCL